MKRLTFEEFQKLLANADNHRISATTLPTRTMTREGIYISLAKGLTSSFYFYGKDLETNEVIIEQVG